MPFEKKLCTMFISIYQEFSSAFSFYILMAFLLSGGSLEF